jgi:hypothetical protein
MSITVPLTLLIYQNSEIMLYTGSAQPSILSPDIFQVTKLVAVAQAMAVMEKRMAGELSQEMHSAVCNIKSLAANPTSPLNLPPPPFV